MTLKEKQKIACHFKEAVGRRIRTARKIHKLTQEQLGKKTKLSGDWICNIESGRRGCDIGTLSKLARSLHVTVDFLCGNGNHKPKPEGEA